MRILSIAGQNIASLADPFLIDFTAAPLAGAGLFAITGETGAGKSSILDALCLALYGDAPRLSTGAAGDEISDPSGEAIKARDSRAILRRGAIQGWAEVRFTARDGQDYIARWQARRARDKVNGKLQSVARSLARAADQQILASQTSAVTEQIIALTGLSYEEFRRTVLLAQGDFDAFLRADTNERAGLLEKVTGTGLYRAVSRRIFDRTDAARQGHDTLTLRRAEHRLLTDDARNALMGELTTLVAASSAAITDRLTHLAAVDRHNRHAEALRQLDLATGQAARTLQASQDAAPARDRLARIDQAEPLRLPWQRLRDAEARVARAAGDLATAETAHTTATAQAQTLRLIADQNDQLFVAKEAEFKVLGPQWDDGAALDAQITTAASEAETSALRAKAVTAEAEQATADLATLHHAETTARDALIRAQADLTALQPAQGLTDRWDLVRADITTYRSARQAAETAQALALAEAAKIAHLDQRTAAHSQRATEDERQDIALRDRVANLTSRILDLETLHPHSAAKRLTDLAAALLLMTRADDDHQSAQNDLAAAGRSEAEGTTAAITAKTAAAAASATAALFEAQVAVLTAPVEQADLALSDAAKELRLRLEPDTPCPVCGSREHPVHVDKALADLALRLRSDLAAARQGADLARAQQRDAERFLATAEAQSDQARRSAATSNNLCTKALSDWAQALTTARALDPQIAFPARPGDRALLTAISARTQADHLAHATAQAEIASLRTTLSTTNTQLETLRQTAMARNADREALAAQRGTADRALALARQTVLTEQTLADQRAATLAPLLSPLGAADALADPTLATRLAALVQRALAARDLHRTATDRLSDLLPRIAAQSSTAHNLTQAADLAHAQSKGRHQRYEALRTQRAPLLDGVATSLHRTRFNESRKAALAARDAAQTAYAAAANLAVAARTRHDAAQQETQAATGAARAADQSLQQTLSQTGLDAQSLALLLLIAPDEVQALRDHLRALDDAVTAARAARAARQTDLASARQAGLPETPAADLRAMIAQLDTTLAAHQARRGAIANEIATDDASRLMLAGLDAEITSALLEYQVWQAVNAAVGSRSGDKFARLAQSITLDVLADHANHHLADLNPRYRLRRADDLALQVEDVDMGGEARATRSLSGGERFLVSLALALALSRMGDKGGLAATLFIDEGFGSLDAASLEVAIDALDNLQSQGRQVGVISHVEAMKDRITTRITVTKQGSGKSVVRICPAPGTSHP